MASKAGRCFPVSRVVALRDADAARGYVRVHRTLIDRRKSDANRLYRREAVCIIDQTSGRKVVRNVVGASSDYDHKDQHKIAGPATIALDYDGCDVLGVSIREDVDLVVRRASWWEQIVAMWNDDSFQARMANRAMVLGVVVGVFGLVVGCLPVILAL